jgi:hypothetical protein
MSDENVQDSQPQGKPEKFSVQHTWSLKIAYLLAIGLLSLLFVDPSKLLPYQDPLEGSIAIVVEKSNDVKRKHPRAASWSAVKKDDKLYPNSMIYTGKDSYVKIALIDASIINQGPESLLRLRIATKKKKKKKASAVDSSSNSPGGVGDELDDALEDEGEFEEGSGIALELDGGNIDIQASENSDIRSVATRDTKIELESGTGISLKNTEDGSSSEIAVTAGQANIKTKSDPQKSVALKKDEKIDTKKLREEEEKADQEVVEKIKGATNAAGGFGEKSEIKRKGILEIMKEIGKIILFLD